jgi:hypothetical protein
MVFLTSGWSPPLAGNDFPDPGNYSISCGLTLETGKMCQEDAGTGFPGIQLIGPASSRSLKMRHLGATGI